MCILGHNASSSLPIRSAKPEGKESAYLRMGHMWFNRKYDYDFCLAAKEKMQHDPNLPGHENYVLRTQEAHTPAETSLTAAVANPPHRPAAVSEFNKCVDRPHF